MLLLATLLLVSAQDAPPVEDSPITVIARRLNAWRGKFNIHDGAVSCVTKKSTGDKDIDAVGCDALTTCVVRFKDRIIASAERSTPAETRRQLGEAVNKDIVACLTDERARLVGELADRRAAAQTNGQ